jgi:long-chain fatty acid transport protein
MKKGTLLVMLCIVWLAVFSASAVWAGGAVNRTNWSAEYIRTLNRNAATDSADIVMYNPAGVMMMEDGLYGNISAHYIAKDYNNKINGTDFDQDEPSIVPGVFAVYKSGPWAGFFGASNITGGGKIKFEDGNVTSYTLGLGIIQAANAGLAANSVPSNFYYTGISSQNLNAEHIGLAYTFGGAYKFNDRFSLSLGARYLDSPLEASGSVTITPTNSLSPYNDPLTAIVDYEESASGWGGVIGFNITPSDAVNIGIHYDTQIDLDYDQTVNDDNFGVLGALGVTDGGTRTRNLPAILALGISYKFGESWRTEASLTYYLNENADFEDIPGTSRDESAVDNGYDVGFMVEYGFSEALKGSMGYIYTRTGVEAKDMTPELPELDAHTLGAGLVWEATPGFDINWSLGQVFYQSESFTSTATGLEIEYEKSITFAAIGFQYKFF